MRKTILLTFIILFTFILSSCTKKEYEKEFVLQDSNDPEIVELIENGEY